MCIAILNTYSALSRETLSTCWENNYDGAGLLWVNESGALETFKELNSFKVFFKKYSAVRKSTRGPVVLHFRIGTHGNHAEYNLHPFLISPEIGFVHNGVFRLPEIEKKYSDTWHFNALILQTMKAPARLFKLGSNESHLINHFVGSSSKLIFLNRKGDFRIFNESAGHWDKSGNWYSNNSYKASKFYDFGGKKVAKKDAGKIGAPGYSSRPYSGNWWDEKEYSGYSGYSRGWNNYAAPAAKVPAPAPAKIEKPAAPAAAIPAAPAPAESGKPRVRISSGSGEYQALESLARDFGFSMSDSAFPGFISAALEKYGCTSYSELSEHAQYLANESGGYHVLKRQVTEPDFRF